MIESLFTLPESYDDDLLLEMLPTFDGAIARLASRLELDDANATLVAPAAAQRPANYELARAAALL